MQASEKLRCSSRIAAALLDSLSATGNHAGHGCVRRVYENEAVNPRTEGAWISASVIDAAFRSLDADRNLARRVGYALVSSERIGFMLYSGGVATIEKAYRRCEVMLPREESDGRFHTLDVSGGRARIVYHPGASRHLQDGGPAHGPWNTNFCGVRQGMLEAMPLSFGLMPARVRETECVGKGASHCSFEVDFDGRSVRGTSIGLGLGALASLLICGLLIPNAEGWAQGVVGVLVSALSGVAGYAFDLAGQLQAVAGARRGHLALLEQADRALAEKMDELAKMDARAEPGASDNTDRLRRLLEEREDAGETAVATNHTDVDHAENRRSKNRLGSDLIQLDQVVSDVVQQVRTSLLPGQRLRLDVEDGLPEVRCSQFQFEQVAEQLIKNATNASFDDGEVRVRLQRGTVGIELIVEDDGSGIPDELLDQLFDPFAENDAAGSDGGLGLAICHRIVLEHGGEMSVASDVEQGTRVSVALPLSDSACR